MFLCFKSLGSEGKQKELLCIENTVDLMNRAPHPFHQPVSREKRKEEGGKTKVESMGVYRGRALYPVPSLPRPLTATLLHGF